MTLTDFFTQIADSIRSKDGTTESITAKDFPQRILDIQSGGSDVKVATGTIVLSEDRYIKWNQYTNSSMEIEHGLGVSPNFAILYDADYTGADNYPAYSNALINLLDCGPVPYQSASVARTYNATGGISKDTVSNEFEIDKRYTDTLYRFGFSNGVTLFAGRTYKWIIGRV